MLFRTIVVALSPKLITALNVGSHTFKMQWRRATGDGTGAIFTTYAPHLQVVRLRGG